MKNISLYISSVIFLIIAVIQFLRFELGVQVVVGNGHQIPLHLSLYAAGFFLFMALWMLIAALIRPKTY